jgi:hypothetical protein
MATTQHARRCRCSAVAAATTLQVQCSGSSDDAAGAVRWQQRRRCRCSAVAAATTLQVQCSGSSDDAAGAVRWQQRRRCRCSAVAAATTLQVQCGGSSDDAAHRYLDPHTLPREFTAAYSNCNDVQRRFLRSFLYHMN